VTIVTSDNYWILGRRGQALDITAYLSRSNPPVAISMRIDGDLSLCIPLPCKNCLSDIGSTCPIETTRSLQGIKTLSGLCNDGDTLGQTEKEWPIWYG